MTPSMDTEYLSCKTPTCRSTANNISASVALALIEYHSQYRPGYALTSGCERCNRTSSYTCDEVLALIPPSRRPASLQHDHFWSFIVIEFQTEKSGEFRTFLGDRLLVQRLYTEADTGWYGIVRSLSPYASTLTIGSYVRGRPWGRYEHCVSVVEEGIPKPLPRPAKITRTSSYAIFLSPAASARDLLCANIACSNPSCGFLYSTITFEKFKKVAEPAPVIKPYYSTGDVPVMTLHCEFCGAARVVDERSFEGLFRGNLSEFKQ